MKQYLKDLWKRKGSKTLLYNKHGRELQPIIETNQNLETYKIVLHHFFSKFVLTGVIPYGYYIDFGSV